MVNGFGIATVSQHGAQADRCPQRVSMSRCHLVGCIVSSHAISAVTVTVRLNNHAR